LQMRLAIEFVAICIGLSTVGTLLSLAWYKVTQGDAPDKGTVLFFVKLWYGFGVGLAILGLLVKYG
jgi:hypothetical protein